MELPWIPIIVLCVTLATISESAPAGCAILTTIISGCDCEGPVDNTENIVINCRWKDLKSMPNITGTYDGVIYDFTLLKNEIEEIPADAFQGLKIQRLHIEEDNLKNISDFAFRGLEDTLIVLKINGGSTMQAAAPFAAMSNLTNLQELSLSYFQAPANDMEDPSYFQPFSSLQSLLLDHWNLVSIGDNVFRGLTSLKTIQLSYHPSMISYPAGAMMKCKATLESIEVSNTGIPTLTQYIFDGFLKLKTLKFRSNSLTSLEESCFHGLETSLETLDLSFNKIPIGELGQLQLLRGLKVLNVQNSGISSLSREAEFLKNKPLLRQLDLSRNPLLNVPSRIFENLTSLTDLELSYNQISSMADDSLKGLTSLKSLILDHQQLTGTSLTLPSMADLTSLTYLTLWSTPVSGQSWGKISQVASLEYLSMRDTRLTSIPPLLFRMMTNLTTLHLDDNQISSINQKTFTGPKNSLKEISLSNNQINDFDSCTFFNYSTKVNLELINNPLHCDCTLYWLSSAVKAGTITLSYPSSVKCAYPRAQNGTEFVSLDPSEMCVAPPTPPVCDDHYTQTTTVSPTTPPTTLPTVTVTALFLSSTTGSITIAWKLNQPELVSYIHVLHSEARTAAQKIKSRQLQTSDPQYELTQLKSNTPYEICVEAYNKGGGVIGEQCINHRTTGSDVTTVDPTQGDKMSNSQEIGIIIGSVIGGLVLLAILIAIIYLIVIRRKSPKEKYPVQPRTFTPGELPTLGYDSKRYRRKKKDATDGKTSDVQVTVISDGQNKAPNIGRISAGSYQYLQEKQPVSQHPVPPYVNDAAIKQATDPYENDNSLRPLPKMPADPADSGASYYNPAFRNSTADDQQPNMYSEIHL